MAFAIKKVNPIAKIVRLKQLMNKWKSLSLNRRSAAAADSDSNRKRTPTGTLAVYVGIERRRFVIPTRFLNLPLFVSLLDKAEEEFGFQRSGGLILPCEIDFFEAALKLLERDEHRFGGFGFEEFSGMLSDPVVEDYFSSTSSSSSTCCKDSVNNNNNSNVYYPDLTPLLQQKIRV